MLSHSIVSKCDVGSLASVPIFLSFRLRVVRNSVCSTVSGRDARTWISGNSRYGRLCSPARDVRVDDGITAIAAISTAARTGAVLPSAPRSASSSMSTHTDHVGCLTTVGDAFSPMSSVSALTAAVSRSESCASRSADTTVSTIGAGGSEVSTCCDRCAAETAPAAGTSMTKSRCIIAVFSGPPVAGFGVDLRIG